MKIISWNVNGLRAIYKKGAWDEILEEVPDILCIQETKSTLVELPDPVKSPLGFYSFFNSPKHKKGYSGVGLYSKIKPKEVVYDLKGDEEGRLIEAHFEKFILFNVYFPNGGGGPERLSYKLDFYEKFLVHIQNLRKKGFSIIFCGDINTAHREIDLARPKENVMHTGFLPEERAWIDKVLSRGFRDVYRDNNPNLSGAYTYWDMKTFARERNVGWRIDYFFVSDDLSSEVKDVQILNEIYGSDHCPILITLKDN